jgi:hypothetical protein
MKRIFLLLAIVALLGIQALPAQAEKGIASGFVKWFQDNMGLEIGSVTIGGVGYSKAVLAPEVRIGRLKMGLYFPVIYKDDLFNPATWYRPGGNNEWNFGADYWATDIPKAALDLVSDVVLKFKYLEYGRQLEDPFFFKVGNLHDLTVGHGLIMRGYRNDTDFPGIRRTGVNLGLEVKPIGLELLASDLPVPEIVGARLYFMPFKKSRLAFGVSAVADLAAAKELEGQAGWDAAVGNVVLGGAGVDVDVPIVPRSALLGLRAYAGAAVNTAFVTADFTSPLAGGKTITSQDTMDILWNGLPRNWGAAAGLAGNVAFIDWRLEYRYYTGVFRSSFFDSTYERSRSQLVQKYMTYLDDPTSLSDAATVMGVYGEAGFSILKEKLTLVAGYMWPWSLSSGGPALLNAEDELHLALVIKKGLIPVVDLHGAIYYDKWGLVSSIADGSFEFFDSRTALAGEVVFPVPGSPNLGVAAIFKAIVARNADGSVIYVDPSDISKGVKIIPAITIETRISF